MYKFLQILILTTFFPLIFYAQSLQIKHVYKIPEESFTQYDPESFLIDSLGNYCYEVKIDSFCYYFTNSGLVGKSDFIGGIKGNGKNSISYTDKDGFLDKEELFWYRNNYSTMVYGPEYGNLEESITSSNGNGIAIIISRNDSLFYIINGVLLYSVNKSSGNLPADDWCVFNKNGDYLLRVWLEGLDLLYLNGTIIDSAMGINDLGIDNSGNYIYTRYDSGSNSVEIIYNKKVLFSGDQYARGEILQSGKYSFLTYSDKNEVMIFNDTFYYIPKCPKFSDSDSRIKKYTSFSSFINVCNLSKNKYYLNYNNKLNQEFNEIYDEICDSEGNYSYFGKRDYYLYTVTNGIITDTVTRFGLRGKPIYISPKGNYLAYFEKEDSIYIFNNKDLFKTISVDKQFNTKELYYAFRFYDERTEQQNDAKCITIGNETYILINENMFGPFNKFNESWGKPGYIINGKITENGSFYFFQISGERKCKLYLNGVDYGEIENDEVFENSIVVNEKGLKFYIINLNNVYEVTTYAN